MKGISWLSVFKTILHGAIAAGRIAAPIVTILYPVEGALLLQATNAVVGAEATITAPQSGPQRAALVREQTQATVDVINEQLTSQGKPPLPTDIVDVVQQHVKTIVAGLNSVQQALGAVADSAPAESPVSNARVIG